MVRPPGLGYGAGTEGSWWRATLGKLIADVDPVLEDYIEAAAQAEHISLDAYAGALLQVGWEAVYGHRRSDRLKRAASASRASFAISMVSRRLSRTTKVPPIITWRTDVASSTWTS